MPRIAASLAVLLTAVTCIGFNTARYPAVWRMLTLSEGAGAADRSDDPTASTQSVAAAEPEALAPSAPSWPSDGQADDDGTDLTNRASTAGESSPAYVSGEDGSSDDDSDERVDQARDQGSHDGWNELPRESSFGSYAPPPVASSELAQEGGTGSYDYDPDAGDDYKSAAGGGYESRDDDQREPVEQVAVEEPPEPTDPEPEEAGLPYDVDPVAPQGRPAASSMARQEPSEDESDSDRSDVSGKGVSAPDTADRPTGEPVEAPASGRYASYPIGARDDSCDGSPDSSGATIVEDDAGKEQTDAADRQVPQTTLTPIKPMQPEHTRDESLALRPWGSALSLPEHIGLSGSTEVTPLPPVEEVATVAVAASRQPAATDSIRIYPTTGIE